IKKLYTIFVEASVQTAIVMFVVSMASVFAHIITTERYARDIADSLLSISDSPIVILLIINVILLIAGAFIDAISAFYIFVPILLPIIIHFDIDPTVFGVFMTVNLAIGFCDNAHRIPRLYGLGTPHVYSWSRSSCKLDFRCRYNGNCSTDRNQNL